MRLFQLYTPEKVSEFREALSGANFSDGKATAIGAAAGKKANRQLLDNDSAGVELLNQLRQKIMASREIACYAYPQRLVGMRVNAYQPGDYYGWHVDVANMDGYRTDMSFTLFLSEPEHYQGGELELNYGTHINQIKAKAGQLVIYPTGVRHQVKEVTKGERMAVVGWIRSMVRHQEQREMLFNLALEIGKLKKRGLPDSDLEHLNYCYQGFLRTLSE